MFSQPHKFLFTHCQEVLLKNLSLRLKVSFGLLTSIQPNLISLSLPTTLYSSITFKSNLWLLSTSQAPLGSQACLFTLKEIILFWELMIRRLYGLIWTWDQVLIRIWSIMIKLLGMCSLVRNILCLQVLVMMDQSIYSMD